MIIKYIFPIIGLFASINTINISKNESYTYQNEAIQYEDNSHNISNLDELEGKFNDKKTFSFIVDSIMYVDVIGKGLNYSSSIFENKVYITFSNVTLDATSKITFGFIDGKEKINIYFNCSSTSTYYSFLSKDSLLRYMGLLDDVNYDNDKLDAKLISNNSITQKAVALSDSSSLSLGIINGYMKWKNSNNDEFPLVGMKVKIETSIGNYETYTDNNGYYLFYLIDDTQANNPFSNIKLHIYSESESTYVVYDETTLYEKCWSNIDLSERNDAYELSYTFSPAEDKDKDLGKAMQISQAAKYYSDYIKSLNNNVAIAQCKFNYPNNPLKGCYYSSNIVHITSKNPEDNSPYSYESWDVIGHEYGHHIQKIFSISNSSGGNHYSSKNNADINYEKNGLSKEDSKEKGLKLAWGESWPTYWAITAQQTFPDNIKNINTVADSNYTSYNGLDYSLDSYDSDGIKGEGCERAIMRFLYKLYSNSTDEIDKFAIGDKKLWDIINTSKPYYFYQFISALYSNGYSKSNLGLLLEAYRMSASNLSISNLPSTSSAPSFTWEAQGGSVYFPNDLFILSFYNQSKTKIFEITDITSNEYALTTEQWNTLLHAYGSKYYVMIESYASNYLSTGPYYSTYYEFTKPTNSIELTSSVNINSFSRYYEKNYDILPNSNTSLSVKFSTSGYKVLQTFGNSDVFMSLYSADGKTLLASNDDNGYELNSWIYYYFDSSNTYIIQIRSYNQNNSAKTKLSITPSHNFIDESKTSLTSYDYILNVSNTTDYYLTKFCEQYYSGILTFTPTQTGTYTIDLTSEFDNYLYVINPKSSDLIITNIDYNDDSNGTNASLTKTLTAGIKYYIVFSQYNLPSTIDSLNGYNNCSIHIYLN